MKACTLFLFICLKVAPLAAPLGSWAQTAPPAAPLPMPDLPDETLVAKFDDGTQLTMGDFKKIYHVLPPGNQQSALHDRKEFLHQWALFRKLAKQAEERKLAEESPYKEAMEYARMQVLIPARLNDELNSINVETPELTKRSISRSKSRRSTLLSAARRRPSPPGPKRP